MYSFQIRREKLNTDQNIYSSTGSLKSRKTMKKERKVRREQNTVERYFQISVTAIKM